MIDFIILQQDNFDAVDRSTSIERQKYMLEKIMGVTEKDLHYTHFSEVAPFFKNVINILKQMNYSPFKKEKFKTISEIRQSGILNFLINRNVPDTSA